MGKIDFSYVLNHTKVMRHVVYICFTLLFLMVSCRQPTPAKEVEWNFLVYMAADNDLESFAIQDINEMERVGSTAHVNILVLVDRSPYYDTTNGNWSGTRLYQITRDYQNSSTIVSKLIKDYGELDMSNPRTLKKFVDYCNDYYPAARTLLTLWNHGSGVFPRSVVNTRGMGIDETTGGSPWDMLHTDEIATALTPQEGGKKIDILNVDACLMQMFEIGVELAEVAHIITASQASIPALGNEYTSLLQYITANFDQPSERIATYVVDHFYSFYDGYVKEPINYSALSIDLLEGEVFPAFTRVVDKLLVLPEAELRELWKIRVFEMIDDGDYGYVDIREFFLKLKDSGIPRNIGFEEDVTTLLTALERATISHRVAMPSSSSSTFLNGLSINFPIDQLRGEWYTHPDGYQNLRLPSESRWYQFLTEVNSIEL